MGWVATGQAINVLLNFIIIKQLSSMGTVGYGIYALIFTINMLATYLIYGPGIQSFIRFYYTYSEQGYSSTFVSMMNRFIVFTGGAILITGLAAAALSFTGLLKLTIPLIFLGTLFTIGHRSSDFFSSSLNMIRKRKQNSILQNSEKLLSVILLFIIYKMNLMLIEYVLLILVVSAAVFSLAKFYIFRRNAVNKTVEVTYNKKSEIKREIKKTVFAYALPFVIWGIAGWLQSNSEKWIIADYLSTSDVGIYALMMNLVNAFIIIPNTIITDFSTPIIYQNFSDLNNKEKVRKGFLFIKIIILVVFAAALFTSLLTYFFGELIIRLISSEAFTAYAYLLPLLCIGMGLFFVGQAMCVVGMALNVPKKYILPKIISGLLAIGINILFLVNFGITGIAWSSVCLGLFYSLYIWTVNKKILGDLRKA